MAVPGSDDAIIFKRASVSLVAYILRAFAGCTPPPHVTSSDLQHTHLRSHSLQSRKVLSPLHNHTISVCCPTSAAPPRQTITRMQCMGHARNTGVAGHERCSSPPRQTFHPRRKKRKRFTDAGIGEMCPIRARALGIEPRTFFQLAHPHNPGAVQPRALATNPRWGTGTIRVRCTWRTTS